MKTTNNDPIVYHTFGHEGKTIIIYHGWGSSINTYRDFASNLAELGFRVVLPELTYHDSRGAFEQPFLREVTQRYFWKTIFQSIDEAPALVKELQISTDEIILFGSSMGGFIASGIASNHPEIAGLISVNSSGSFLITEGIFRKNDGRPELNQDEKRVLNTYDPIEKKSNPSSVLLMHGKEDQVISIEGQLDYYKTMKSRGADITFLTYEHVNHKMSDNMIDDMNQWLIQNFKE